MIQPSELPDGLEHVRTTPVFDQDSVPKGLLQTHRIAEGVWGRLVVHTGSLAFESEDDDSDPQHIDAGHEVVIPPQRPHHLTISEPVTFAVEFHKPI